MSFKKLSFSFWATALLIIIAAVSIGYKYQQNLEAQDERAELQVRDDRPVAVLNMTEYDWGSIPRTPAVENDFEISNEGKSPLEISLLVTSCGCTIAELIIDAQKVEIPAKLAPGDSGIIHVVFDPDAHDSRGPTKRAVRIETNDPVNPFQIINLTADVQ